MSSTFEIIMFGLRRGGEEGADEQDGERGRGRRPPLGARSVGLLEGRRGRKRG